MPLEVLYQFIPREPRSILFVGPNRLQLSEQWRVHKSKKAYLHEKRDLLMSQNKPTNIVSTRPATWQKRPIYMAKETYSNGKRNLFMWQKRPIHVAKETYSCGTRDLFMWQKRPIHVAKEASECSRGMSAPLFEGEFDFEVPGVGFRFRQR